MRIKRVNEYVSGEAGEIVTVHMACNNLKCIFQCKYVISFRETMEKLVFFKAVCCTNHYIMNMDLPKNRCFDMNHEKYWTLTFQYTGINEIRKYSRGTISESLTRV